ncbi:NADPH-dependent ferric siderophore reductase [Microbacterium sp. SLBN-154]|uniref:siderophore-interacting protein n=1 Tax=Microbacterium sp. SLBN-154 TaxID=2768458 RepID=UPI001153D04E|nr:siderophore-interacting protein [Microbacterium sp. SLBN-154]TQK18540.1 NADPH-dependent ferric siderophore reductase [Microbacterium sp. SLBN-154]
MPESSFSFRPQGHELRFRRLRLADREWVTPGYVRVRLVGDDMADFVSAAPDDHVRIFFPDGDPRTDEELAAAPSREYTPARWGADWLDLEFVLHGDPLEGPAGAASTWAATAPTGALAGIRGPRGSKIVDGRPDFWLLAGDETAMPAMRRFAGIMDDQARGRIFVEVADAAHELPIDAPAGVAVEQVHRGTTAPGSALAARLSALGGEERPAGSILGFIAAEQSIVKPGRELLLERWGVPADQTVIKGYWKRGETSEKKPR